MLTNAVDSIVVSSKAERLSSRPIALLHKQNHYNRISLVVSNMKRFICIMLTTQLP